MFGEKWSEVDADKAEVEVVEQPITEEAARVAAETKRKQLQIDIADSSTGESNQE